MVITRPVFAQVSFSLRVPPGSAHEPGPRTRAACYGCLGIPAPVVGFVPAEFNEYQLGDAHHRSALKFVISSGGAYRP